MKRLTLLVDDDAYERARKRADDRGTTIESLIREFIRDYSHAEGTKEQAVNETLRAALRADTGHGAPGWTRGDG